MFADVIREARNEHEIYFLLTSYVEAVRFGDQLNVVPEKVKDLPLNASRVRQQYQTLLELSNQGKRDSTSAVLDEALPIFGAALQRLEALDKQS